MIPSFSHLLGNVNAETDLDGITLDDLNLGSSLNIADPAEIIREYLHPMEKDISTEMFVSHNLTVSFIILINVLMCSISDSGAKRQ